MSEPVEIETREKAYAIAAVRALGTRAEALCARRSPALKRYAQQLLRDPALVASFAEQLDCARPVGLAEVHPSWYEAPALSSRPEAAAWLERRAYGHLVEMTRASADAAPAVARALERLSADALAQLVLALGRRRVATAFSGAPRTALAQLCARLGEPAASELLEQVRALSPQVATDEVRAAQRAVFQLVEPQLADDRDPAPALFLRAGAGWLAPAIAARGADRLRRLAQRLPRPLGEALLGGGRTPASDAECAAALKIAATLLAAPRPRDL
jgi:hypothetical protein